MPAASLYMCGLNEHLHCTGVLHYVVHQSVKSEKSHSNEWLFMIEARMHLSTGYVALSEMI